jgi:anti-sigma B factor antagonist
MIVEKKYPQASCIRPQHGAGTAPLRTLVVRPVMAGSDPGFGDSPASSQAPCDRGNNSPAACRRAPGIAAPANTCPVRWAGRQAVMTIRQRMDVSTAGQIRDELLSVINRGARVLIAEMTATASCDHAGADAVVRACQRGVTGGMELRLVTAQIVSRVLCFSGVDRLVAIYPSLEAATAALAQVAAPAGTGTNGQPPPHPAARAGRPAQATGPADGTRAGTISGVMGELAGPLRDGRVPAEGRTLGGAVSGYGR